MGAILELWGGAWTRADALSLSQAIFTILGFAIAIKQLARSATAAEETNAKIARYSARLAGNDLLVGLPELHKIEDEMDAALKKADGDELERCLVRYSRRSSQLLVVLASEDDADDAELIKFVAAASKASSKAKTDISKGGVDVLGAARIAYGKIVNASTEVSGAIARRQRKLDE